jgi:alpha-galactosidase
MGWNSWPASGAGIGDAAVRDIALALAASGLRDAGYRYVVIGGWQGGRGADGVLRPNGRFPDMRALAAFLHSHGFKFGLSSSPGACAGFEGSFNHEHQDAKMFAAWGVDYLAYDGCGAGEFHPPSGMRAVHQKMAEALRATGRPIVYAIRQPGREDLHEWAAKAGANLWSAVPLAAGTGLSHIESGFRLNGLEKYAGPGRWHDPGLIGTGDSGPAAAGLRARFTLWAMLAAPLFTGAGIRAMSPETRSILLNREVIAVNQDRLGRPGARVALDGPVEVWTRQIGGAIAVAVFNRGGQQAAIKLNWRQIGAGTNPKIRDLWAGRDLPRQPAGHTVDVPPHGAVLLKVTGEGGRSPGAVTDRPDGGTRGSPPAEPKRSSRRAW